MWNDPARTLSSNGAANRTEQARSPKGGTIIEELCRNPVSPSPCAATLLTISSENCSPAANRRRRSRLKLQVSHSVKPRIKKMRSPSLYYGKKLAMARGELQPLAVLRERLMQLD